MVETLARYRLARRTDKTERRSMEDLKTRTGRIAGTDHLCRRPHYHQYVRLEMCGLRQLIPSKSYVKVTGWMSGGYQTYVPHESTLRQNL